MNLMTVCVFVGFWHSRSFFQRSLKALSCTCWVKLICHQVATGGYRGLWGLGFWWKCAAETSWNGFGLLFRRFRRPPLWKWPSQIWRYLQKHASSSKFTCHVRNVLIIGHRLLASEVLAFSFVGLQLLQVALNRKDFLLSTTVMAMSLWAQNDSEPALPEAQAITSPLQLQRLADSPFSHRTPASFPLCKCFKVTLHIFLATRSLAQERRGFSQSVTMRRFFQVKEVDKWKKLIKSIIKTSCTCRLAVKG